MAVAATTPVSIGRRGLARHAGRPDPPRVPQRPIAICLGGASEALRLAPVVRELRRRDRPAVVVTLGRRTRMFGAVLETFVVERGVDLAPVLAEHTAADRTAAATRALGGAFGFIRPEAVVFQADTATALCAGPTAFSRGIPVGQVEAGTTADRRFVGRLATWHFAPDTAARERLIEEGVDPGAIAVTGGTVADAARFIARRDGLLGRAPAAGARRVLVALRRGEGRDDADRRAARVLARIAERADVEVALAAPRSPLLGRELAPFDNVVLVDGLRWERFVAALAASHLLLTDAAPVAEAAAALGVPTVALDDPAVALVAAERALDDAGPHRRLVPVPDREEGAAARIVARLAGDLPGAATDVHSARLTA
jgi:UDP-N-acetylglucosamine 2-epimerase (non-hydrolysing)